MILTIPFPPVTGNHMWKASGRRRFVVPAVENYYQLVRMTAARQNAIFGLSQAIEVEMLIYPPDRKKRDLSNLVKVIEDACTKAGVWADDSLIEVLRIKRMPVDKTPRVEIRIECCEILEGV